MSPYNGYQRIVTYNGNDKADKLAKEGSKLKQDKKKLSYNAVKSHVSTTIKSNIKKTWEKASKGKLVGSGHKKGEME
jgi:hypothetical protein